MRQGLLWLALALLVIGVVLDSPSCAGTFPWGAGAEIVREGEAQFGGDGMIVISTSEFDSMAPSWMLNPRFFFYQGHLIRVSVTVSDVRAARNALEAIYGLPHWIDEAVPVLRWAFKDEAIELRPAKGGYGHELVWAATRLDFLQLDGY